MNICGVVLSLTKGLTTPCYCMFTGNLAASVALRFKKKIRLQVLIYPILQMFNFQTSSYTELNGKLKYVYVDMVAVELGRFLR